MKWNVVSYSTYDDTVFAISSHILLDEDGHDVVVNFGGKQLQQTFTV